MRRTRVSGRLASSTARACCISTWSGEWNGLPGLNVCVLEEQQPGERERHGGEAEPRREDACERERDPGAEERTVASARHLADGEVRVRRRVDD